MADGIYVKLSIFNRPEQKEGSLPWFYIDIVQCNLRFDIMYFSTLNITLK